MASTQNTLDYDLLSPFVVSERAVASCTPNTFLKDVVELCGFFFLSHKPLLVAGVQLTTLKILKAWHHKGYLQKRSEAGQMPTGFKVLFPEIHLIDSMSITQTLTKVADIHRQTEKSAQP